ncbi:MAG: hypothetical protein ACR2H1_15320, partial [Limisphaerales bacterium]
ICVVILISALSGVWVGCSGTKLNYGMTKPIENSVAQNEVAGLVILASKQCSHFKANFLPLWDPETNSAREALGQIPMYLKGRTNEVLSHTQFHKQLPLLVQRLPNTLCQAVGVTVEKRKAILLNFLPVDHFSSRLWREAFVKVHDGGPRWWSIVYLPQEKKFTNLWIDLGF